MEIRINKEIKDYHESLFFGLSTRQFICSVAAVGAAVGIYFGLKNHIDKETVSWLCIVAAAPIAVTGFFKTGENEEFDFDLKKAMEKGADFKDYIAPDNLEFYQFRV